MKKFSVLLLMLGSATLSYGQKVELGLQLNAGATTFVGKSASETSAITVADWGAAAFYTHNPFGSKPRPAFGASLQLQRVGENGLIFGAQAGIEQLRSLVKINRAYVANGNDVPTEQEAEGESLLKADFFQFQPYLGWRLLKGSVDLDLTLGTDVAFGRKIQAEGEATLADGSSYETAYDFSKPKTDFRPRVGLTLYRGHFGLSASYAHGLTNYKSDWDGGTPKQFLRAARLGLIFRL
jgi:hypothetical protein